MKNVIFLIIDSLSEDRIQNCYCDAELMPFINQQKNHIEYFTNFYSQGPYTEAGTKSLLCGSNALDSFGYLFRFDKSSSFITKTFFENGYNVENLIYPTCLLPEWILNTNSNIYHTSHFMFNVLWEQKFAYYADLKSKGLLDDTDISDCCRLLEITFECWAPFLDDCSKSNDHTLLLKDILDSKIASESLRLLLTEKDLFLKNPSEYIIRLLDCKGRHPLLNIKSPLYKSFQNYNLLKTVWTNRKKDIEYLEKQHKMLNLKNNHVDKYFLKNVFLRFKNKQINKYICGEFPNLIHHIKKGKEISKLYPSDTSYVNMVSANKQFDLIPDLISSSKPSFVMCHVEEPHNICTFFSYDSHSSEQINAEIDYALEYARKLKKNYRGLLAYDLSVRYIDKCIENLCNKLAKEGKLENTIICITGDHGTSYNINPPRDRNVVNFHKENYHVPLIFLDYTRKTFSKNESFVSNNDFLALLEGKAGISNNSLEKSGNYYEKQFAFVEFMGAGCPDLRRRPVWLMAISKNFSVHFSQSLSQDFDYKSIRSIYNLMVDPFETNNIYKKRNKEIDAMIDAIRNRFISLQKEYSDYIIKER